MTNPWLEKWSVIGSHTLWIHCEANLRKRCIYHLTCMFPTPKKDHNGILCSSVLLQFLIYLLALGRYIANQKTRLWFSTVVNDISILLINCLLFLIFSQIMTSLAAHLPTPNNIMVYSPSSHIPMYWWPPAGHSNLAADYSNCIHLAVDNYMLLCGFWFSWIQSSPLMA